MSSSSEDKLKAVRAKFASLARGEEAATVVVHTARGDEEYEVQKAPDDKIIWKKIRPAKQDDAA